MGWFTTENDAVATMFSNAPTGCYEGDLANAPFEATITFEPVAGGTRVDADFELSMRGPARLVGGIFAPLVR